MQLPNLSIFYWWILRLLLIIHLYKPLLWKFLYTDCGKDCQNTCLEKNCGCRDGSCTLNLMVSNCFLKLLYQLRLPAAEYKLYLSTLLSARGAVKFYVFPIIMMNKKLSCRFSYLFPELLEMLDNFSLKFLYIQLF